MAVRRASERWVLRHVLCILLGLLLTAPASEARSAAQADVTKPAEAAARAPSVRPEDARQDNDVATALSTTLVREVWNSRIAVPQRAEDAYAETELDRLIRQIRSLKFDTRQQPPAASPARGPAMKNEIQDAASAQLSAGQPARTLVTGTAPQSNAAWPPETMRALQSIVQDPNQVKEPLEMAELLFLSGHPSEAAVLYRRALDRVNARQIARDEDRPWILFQLGNCLRETDTGEARRMYAMLIAEYPNSPWTELAKANSQLIAWQEKVRPHDLVASQPSEP